ncbi:MAG: radical SAM protein [Elusimicrobiota bacterium]
MAGLAEKTRWARRMLHLGGALLPEQVTLLVTRRCNLRCGHCFYWRELNGAGEEFTLAELARLAPTMGRFSFLSLGGGEPFLRGDLPEIAETLVRVNGVSRISIPTNGYLPARITGLARKLLAKTPDCKVVIKVSLDGLGEAHDALRGRAGSFDRAIETLAALKELKKTHAQLRVGVLMTLSKANEERLSETYDHVRRELAPDVVGLNFIRGGVKDPALKGADVDIYRRLYDRILEDQLAEGGGSFYAAYKSEVAGHIEKILRTGRYPMECRAGRLSAVIDSFLNVFPCEGLDAKMGNLREQGWDFRRLWSSAASRRVRDRIAADCCCTCECNLQLNTFFSAGLLLPLLAQAGVRKAGALCGVKS